MKQDICHYIKIGIIASQQMEPCIYNKWGCWSHCQFQPNIWESAIMDFMMLLLEYVGLNAIYVLVDRFREMAHFAPVWDMAMVQEIARFFFQLVAKLYKLTKTSCPTKTRSWQVKLGRWLGRKWETKLKMSTTFRPQTYSWMECVNLVLNQYVRNYMRANHLTFHVSLLKP